MEIVFLNRGDLNEYISTLTNVIVLMSEDLQSVAKSVGVNATSDIILRSYLEVANGPTIFERVLIDEEHITEESCQKNLLMDRILSRLNITKD